MSKKCLCDTKPLLSVTYLQNLCRNEQTESLLFRQCMGHIAKMPSNEECMGKSPSVQIEKSCINPLTTKNSYVFATLVPAFLQLLTSSHVTPRNYILNPVTNCALFWRMCESTWLGIHHEYVGYSSSVE